MVLQAAQRCCKCRVEHQQCLGKERARQTEVTGGHSVGESRASALLAITMGARGVEGEAGGSGPAQTGAGESVGPWLTEAETANGAGMSTQPTGV